MVETRAFIMRNFSRLYFLFWVQLQLQGSALIVVRILPLTPGVPRLQLSDVMGGCKFFSLRNMRKTLPFLHRKGRGIKLCKQLPMQCVKIFRFSQRLFSPPKIGTKQSTIERWSHFTCATSEHYLYDLWCMSICDSFSHILEVRAWQKSERSV